MECLECIVTQRCIIQALDYEEVLQSCLWPGGIYGEYFLDEPLVRLLKPPVEKFTDGPLCVNSCLFLIQFMADCSIAQECNLPCPPSERLCSTGAKSVESCASQKPKNVDASRQPTRCIWCLSFVGSNG